MALICFLLLTAAVSTMILSASQNIDEALKIARAKLSTNMAFLKTSQSSKGTSNNKPLSNGTSHPASSSSAGVAPRVTQGSFESTAKGMLSSRKKQKIAKVLDRPKDKGEIIPEATISAEKLPYLRHRLRAKLAFWATFVKSTLVLQWLSTGYDLRWTDTEPNSAFFPNHASARKHAAYITSNILDLLQQGCVNEVDKSFIHVCSPIGVVEQKGKERMIFDGRCINDHIVVPKFIYYHVDLDPRFWKYFGFEWEGKYYVYTSLPFGLASACWAFTKITRELFAKWRKSGHRCSGYIDDGIYGGQDPTVLHTFIQSVVLPDLQNCGFVVHMKKSNLIPTQNAHYLGLVINSVLNRIEVPQEKRDGVINFIRKILQNKKRCFVNDLEKLAGTLASMHWAFGPISRLMTMSFYADIKKAPHRYAHISLSERVIEDLQFWLSGFDAYNGFRAIWQPIGIRLGIRQNFLLRRCRKEPKKFWWLGWLDKRQRRSCLCCERCLG